MRDPTHRSTETVRDHPLRSIAAWAGTRRHVISIRTVSPGNAAYVVTTTAIPSFPPVTSLRTCTTSASMSERVS
jgi:hypothetical protein